MSRTILLDSIKNKIKTSKTESIFIAADFADISDRVKIGVCLNRLEEEGIIKRILRGVYYKPEFNSFLGEYVAPNPDTVANLYRAKKLQESPIPEGLIVREKPWFFWPLISSCAFQGSTGTYEFN